MLSGAGGGTMADEKPRGRARYESRSVSNENPLLPSVTIKFCGFLT